MSAWIALVLAMIAPSLAHADSGASSGESSRAASLAGAVVGRAGDTSAISANPAAVADVQRSTIALLGHAGRFELSYHRDGERAHRARRGIAGYGVSLIVRMPGPDWLHRLRLGVAVHLPYGSLIGVSAPARVDEPSAPLYGTRLERTAVSAVLAYELPEGFRIGIGLAVAPTLWAPTRVTFDARRGDTVDEGVLVDLEREVRFEARFVAGLRYEPIPQLGFGIAFRQAQSVAATGPNLIRAGNVLADDRIDIVDFYAPDELAWGVCGAPIPELSISVDGVWQRWSDFTTIHHEAPDPRWHDTVAIRAGVEARIARWYAVRAGWAHEPTPVPAQIGPTNLLDGGRQVLAIGLGFDLEEAGIAPLRIDLHGRAHVIEGVHAVKDVRALGDASAVLAGTQLDNLGYPAIEARLSYFDVGLTLTLPLEGR